jgi:hypothetical protein
MRFDKFSFVSIRIDRHPAAVIFFLMGTSGQWKASQKADISRTLAMDQYV